MFMIEYADKGWWYWLVTVVFLSAGVAGYTDGFVYAICITLFQLVHYSIDEKSLTAFPVQVRTGYLLLLLLAWIEPLNWLFWVPTIGTWAQVIFGYCTMARLVSLLPWNSEEKMTLSRLLKTFISPPVRGSIKQEMAARL